MFKAERQYIVSGEKRVGADIDSWAMEPATGQSPASFLHRAGQGKQPVGLSLADVHVCTYTHTQTHALRDRQHRGGGISTQILE